MGKSQFKETSARLVKYLSELDRAQTAREIAEGLEMTTSSAYNILILMEVFGTVQKVKRDRFYYFLKGIYDDEQISAMLPPERVKPIPRRRSILRIPKRPKLNTRDKFREEHLSIMRERVTSFEGPAALAMIGLTQQETIEEEILKEELPREIEADIEVEERKLETTIMNKPHATVEYLPKDVRRLNLGQIKYLKEQLNGLDGFEEIKGFRSIFAKLSALESGRYGRVLYFSMGTNQWDYVHKVVVDPFISDMLVLPYIELNRWSSWNDFMIGIKEPKMRHGKDQYDKIIDQFIKNDHKLVEITVDNRKANYVNLMLNKRIVERGLGEQVTASYVTDWVYLEKVE